MTEQKQSHPTWSLGLALALMFVLVFGESPRLLAQGSSTPIIVTTVVTPPYDPALSVWERNPSRMLVTLQNTDPVNSYTVRIGGSLRSDDGRVVVTIDNAYAASPITLAPGASRSLNARETGLYDEGSVIVTGADRDVIARTGRLPEARYRACLQALDFTTLEPLSAPDPSGCAGFSIQNPEVPRLSYPFCGATIDAVPNQLLAFTWTQPVVQGTLLEYELMIVPIPEGRSPEQAILSTTSPLFFHRRSIPTSTYVYGPSDPDLQLGQRYAWRVRAQAQNGSLTFPNDGWSEVCAFTYGREAIVDDRSDSTEDGGDGGEETESGPTSCFTISAVDPPDRGRWTRDLRPRFTVALDPAIDSSRVTGGTLQVWSDPENAGSSSPDREWSADGSLFLRRQPGVMRAGAPVYDLDIVNGPTGLREWVAENGGSYAWRVTLEFDGNREAIRRDGVACTDERVVSGVFSFNVSTQTTTVADSVCVILTPETPVHNSTVTTPSPVFSIRSLPPLDVDGVEWVELRVWNYLPSDRNPGDASSRAPDFVRRINVQGDADRLSSTFRPGDVTSILIMPNVAETSKSGDAGFYPAVDSSYVWQVALHRRSGRSIRVDGGECLGAPETILSTLGLFHRDTTYAPDEGPCPDSCSAPEPTNRSLREVDFAVGDSVTVGRFSMTLTELASGSPGSLTGRGKVRVPWLRMAVDVEFSNLQVNADNQVLSGVVRARQEASGSPVPGALRNGAGGDLTQDAVTEGLNLATSAARMIDALRSREAVAMPIGFQSSILDDGESTSGPGITIGITDMEFGPGGAALTALAKVPLPFLGREKGLGFGLRNLCFTPSSFTNGVERTLFLAADVGYEDEGSWGFSVLSPRREGGVTTDSGTYITWDCRGVAAFRVAAAVDFPRSMVVPIDENGDVIADNTELVTAAASFLWRRSGEKETTAEGTVEGTMTSSGFHVVATGSVERFAPANAPDLAVEVESIAFDWSDFENPEGIAFPDGYTGETSLLWRGFYMRGATIALPRAISRSGRPNEPVTIGADFVMIDDAGISFSAYAANLLDMREGRAAGWGLSLDTARFVLINNTPKELSLTGKVHVPIFGDGGVAYVGTLQYQREQSNGDLVPGSPAFYLSLSTEVGVGVPMWSARASLGGNVTVSLEKRKSAGWVAGLELNAGMNFTSAGGGGTDESAPAMSIAGIRVAGLRVESVSPYLVSTGDWYLGGRKVSSGGDGGGMTPAEEPTTGDGPSVAGFPLSISDITPSTSQSEGKDLVGVTFNINVNLLPSSGAALSGSTTLGLYGKIEPGGAFGQTFSYSHFEIRRILLDAGFGNVATINGGVEFYRNDPVYGNGFYGKVTATILRKITTDVAAQFGSVNNHRYGFVDFSAKFKTGIPLGSTGVSFYGGGGGIWIGMSRTGDDPDLPVSTTSNPDGFKIGRALSGYRYAPDPNTMFGARIMLTLGTTRPEMFNADVALEISVNNDWGIESVTLDGDAYGLMKAFPEGRADARLRARASMTYLPPKEEFHGVFGATLNQMDVLVLEGDLTLHAGRDKWYMKLGTPTDPVTASLEPLGEVGGVYFMLGMIGDEPRPAPPHTIGAGEPTERSLAIKTGDGLVLGAKGDFSTGRQRYLIFTGEASAAFGFEVSVLHRPGQTCEGAESGLGINGWYGNMSLWAYGSVSLDIDLGDLGSFNLAGVSLSAWLEAGAPNPTWFDGGVQGEYSVMGGLVEGDFDWQFSIGSRCEVPEASLDDVKIITDISPENDARNVSVMAAPTAVFSMNVKDEFPLTLSGVNRTCRMHVDEFSVRSSRGSEKGSGYFLNGGTSWQFMPENVLLGETKYDVLVRVVLQYKVGDEWVDYVGANGKKVSQERSASFHTGKRPDAIPRQNIAYTWPLQNQSFFMREDGPVDRIDGENRLVGKVLLLQAQNYLFASPEGSTRRAYVALVKEGGSANDQIVCQAKLSDLDNRAVLFYFRPGDLDLSTRYSVRLYTQDSLHGGGSATVSEKSKVLYGGKEPFFTEVEAQMLENYLQNDGGRLTPGERAVLIAALAEDKSRRETHVSARTTDRSLEGVEERAGYLTEPKVLAAYRFGTSRYSRIAQKLGESKLSSKSAPYSFVLTNGREQFEEIEVNGYKPPLPGRVFATYFTVNRRIEFAGVQGVFSAWRPNYTTNVAVLRSYWNRFFNGSYFPMPGPGSFLGAKPDYIALKDEFNKHRWLADDLYSQYYSVSCSGGGVVVDLRYRERAKSDYELLVRLQRLYDKYKEMRYKQLWIEVTVHMYQLGPGMPPPIGNWSSFPARTYSFDFIPIVGTAVYQATVHHNVYIP